MAETASENTSLLGADMTGNEEGNRDGSSQIIDGQATSPVEETSPAHSYLRRPIRILTLLVLATSFACGALLLVSEILISSGSFAYYPWNALGAIADLAPFIAIAFVFSIINLRWNFPMVLNLLLDLYLTCATLALSWNFINSLPDHSDWCTVYDRAPVDNPYGRGAPRDLGSACHASVALLRVLMSTTAGFGGVVGLSFCLLFVLRGIASYRSKLWRKLIPLIPTGEVTLVVTIKVLRQQNEIARGPVFRASIVQEPNSSV